MQELISRLTEKAGISTEQASNVLLVVKDFVKEKFPFLEGAIDGLLGGAAEDSTKKENDSTAGSITDILEN